MWNMQNTLDTRIPEEASAVMHVLLTVVQALLGSESEFLMGTKGHIPAYCPLTPAIRSPENCLDRIMSHLTNQMAYLQRGDESFVPQPGEWSMAVGRHHWPVIPVQKVYELLEHAHYNQRYIVDAAGAHVKLMGCAPIESLVLKVRKGIYDPNYYDFIVRFNLSTGGYLHVMDGTAVTSELPHMQREFIHGHSSYFHFLTALIYHDLVTAVEIPFAQPGKKGGGAVTSLAPLREQEGVSWIYIPRVIRGRPQERVRVALSTPRSMEPHRVRGHKRRGKMSDTHREELRRFEKETGFQILNWLPAEHTFVRPHVSPGGSYEWLATLPRFVRARMQQEIHSLLAAPITEDPPF
jgi:hypothetical protein